MKHLDLFKKLFYVLILLFSKIPLNWSIIALQCYVSFCCTTAWISPWSYSILLGHHRAPSWAPCAIQRLTSNSLFYTLRCICHCYFLKMAAKWEVLVSVLDWEHLAQGCFLIRLMFLALSLGLMQRSKCLWGWRIRQYQIVLFSPHFHYCHVSLVQKSEGGGTGTAEYCPDSWDPRAPSQDRPESGFLCRSAQKLKLRSTDSESLFWD